MDLLKILNNPSTPPTWNSPSPSLPKPAFRRNIDEAWSSASSMPLCGPRSGSGYGSRSEPDHPRVPLSGRCPVLASTSLIPTYPNAPPTSASCPASHATTSALRPLTSPVTVPRAGDHHHPKARFLSLPPEIRNTIYAFAARYPTCEELYAGYQRQVDRHLLTKSRRPRRRAAASKSDGSSPRYPRYEKKFRTPTILLLCRTITAECLPFFKSAKFVVDQLPPWGPGKSAPLKLTDFISRRTLQGLSEIEVYVPLGIETFGGGWAWKPIIKELVSVLLGRNSFKHLGVAFSMHQLENESMARLDIRHLDQMFNALATLDIYNPGWWWRVNGKVSIGCWTIKHDSAIEGIIDPQTKEYISGPIALADKKNATPPRWAPGLEWCGDDKNKLFWGGYLSESV